MRKIAIVGMHPRTQGEAWTLDQEWELWGLNSLPWPDGVPRARWFQLHPLDGCDQHEKAWMAKLGVDHAVPTYIVPAAREDWIRLNPACAPHLVDYPLKDVVGTFGRGWLSNTFCLELALAIRELVFGPEVDAPWGKRGEIAIAGVELLSPGRELVVERPALCYWLGLAQGFGVGVATPPQTTLLLHETYGLEYWAEAKAAAWLAEQVLPRHLLDQDNLDTLEAVEAAEARHR